jgi:hypothetical protein
MRAEKLAYRIDHTETVGPNESNPRFSAHGHNPVFDFKPFTADFSKTGRNNYKSFYPFFDTLFYCGKRSLGSENDYAEIHFIRYFCNRRIGLDTENRLGLGINRIQSALVVAAQYVGKDVMPHFSRCV